jgi:hypothetical protein
MNNAIIAFGLWCGKVEVSQRHLALMLIWLISAVIVLYFARWKSAEKMQADTSKALQTH